VKIIVCMKQVPVKDSLLKITDDGSWVHETDLNYEINESDHYALEEALRLKEAHGGEVVLLSMGSERVKEAIKQGLAKGADRAMGRCYCQLAWHFGECAARPLRKKPCQ